MITREQAISIFSSGNADEETYLPYRVLNDAGRNAIRDWLRYYAKSFPNIAPWIADAENAAALPGESVVLELSCSSARDGHTVCLTLYDESFNWAILEADGAAPPTTFPATPTGS